MILLIKSSKDNPAAFAAIGNKLVSVIPGNVFTVSYTHLRAHETPEHVVWPLRREKK